VHFYAALVFFKKVCNKWLKGGVTKWWYRIWSWPG